jgi:hypothetical protein
MTLILDTTGIIEIKMDLKEIGCEEVDWIHMAHDRVR